MRKAFLFCVVLVMVMGISFTATAAPGGFISSPSGNNPPIILEFTIDGEDCSAALVITPYSQRGNLSETELSDIESAYDDIVNNENIANLNPGLKDIAKNLGIVEENLAISDLFDIGIKDCNNPSEHNSFSLKLKAETLENFVGLMYKHDGEWKLVPGATVTGADKDTLTFSTNEISPFAIIVDSEGSHITPPPTGDNVNIGIYIVLMSVSAIALILVGTQLKKKDS